ncbi:hypothetical protein [Marivita hallyeonensis]|uniref:Uncharacterized protein n=1 Tax=Marivita hallyeonensis TaxID=996342 RepID=A0A1M5P7C2_9RHOB|nr:hypothetical protein [Marivita hallyeonensis]SHG97587.1 hypothetical protein SAMN05443551_1181 [Marivita hallyeonensis]
MAELSHVTPVRVSLPASVAADLGTFKKAVGSILDKLGCQACCSGHDIRFDLHRDMVFRDLSDIAVPRATASLQMKAARNTVAMSPEVGAKIDNVYAAIDRIARFSGHDACCSGHDLRLQIEHNFVLDEKLNVDAQAMRFG